MAAKEKIQLKDKFLNVEKELNEIFVERLEPIRGILLATLSETNILFLGPAGVAKSAIIERWNKHITGAKYFYWLLTKFSTPEEIFGPTSFKALAEEKYRRVTDGKISEANSAFIDEIFKANPSILNSMLTILNERIFFNDNEPTHIPLYTVAGASNEIPESDDGLDAFYDRFLLKYVINYIQESGNFLKMITASDIKDIPVVHTVTQEDIVTAQKLAKEVRIPKELYGHLEKLRKNLRIQGFMTSDRAFKVSVRILKANAWLNGRDQLDTHDLEVLRHVVWKDPETRRKAQSIILELTSPEKNKIFEYYDNAMQLVTQIDSKPAGKARKELAMEAVSKLHDAKIDIGKLNDVITARGEADAETKEILISIDRIIEDIYVNTLGLEKDQFTKK